MADDKKVLYYLDDLTGYKVASDYSDVRGWEVIDADNRTIGKVDNLLVNKKTEQVVYLDVEVDTALLEVGHEPLDKPAQEGVHEFVNKEGENHLIIPIGLVHIDDDDKNVYCNEIDHSTFSRTKRFKKGEDIDFAYEQNVLRNYRGDDVEDYRNDDFYNRDEFKYRRDVRPE